MADHGSEKPKFLKHSDPRGRSTLMYGVVCASLLLPLAARSAAPGLTPARPPVPSVDAGRPVPEGRLQFVGQCQERVGPFVTQTTAYQRLQQAQSQGYAVSGVFPCYDGGSRGYCFNVFYQC